MREVVGDLWEYPADAVVIPINWRTKRDGTAVMGAGVAKQAAARYPALPFALGLNIRESRLPYVVVYGAGPELHLACFPTKRDWRQPADLALIEAQAPWLASHATIGGWSTVALPRLGCGLGGLRWADVRPILERHLDARFVVVTPEGEA